MAHVPTVGPTGWAQATTVGGRDQDVYLAAAHGLEFEIQEQIATTAS
jgi:hypothetical protein